MLKKQLEKLRENNPNVVIHQKNNKVSLIFDSASDLDATEILSLGINGLYALEQLDPSFSVYEQTLFSRSALKWNRALLDKESLDKLNEDIGTFLVKLAPHFTLKPALKTLEWLLFKFDVHEKNWAELLFCALPNCDSAVFARLIRFLHVPDQWGLLKTQPDSRSALNSLMLKNRDFFAFVCKNVLSVVNENLISFYLGLFCQALSFLPTVDENVLLIVLPVIFSWITRTKEHQAAAIATFCVILDRCVLDEKVLIEFLDLASKDCSKDLMLLCLIKICQTQPISHLKENFVLELFPTAQGLLEWIEKYSDVYNLDRFIKVCFNSLPKDYTKSWFAYSSSIPSFNKILSSFCKDSTDLDFNQDVLSEQQLFRVLESYHDLNFQTKSDLLEMYEKILAHRDLDVAELNVFELLLQDEDVEVWEKIFSLKSVVIKAGIELTVSKFLALLKTGAINQKAALNLFDFCCQQWYSGADASEEKSLVDIIGLFLNENYENVDEKLTTFLSKNNISMFGKKFSSGSFFEFFCKLVNSEIADKISTLMNFEYANKLCLLVMVALVKAGLYEKILEHFTAPLWNLAEVLSVLKEVKEVDRKSSISELYAYVVNTLIKWITLNDIPDLAEHKQLRQKCLYISFFLGLCRKLKFESASLKKFLVSNNFAKFVSFVALEGHLFNEGYQKVLAEGLLNLNDVVHLSTNSFQGIVIGLASESIVMQKLSESLLHKIISNDENNWVFKFNERLQHYSLSISSGSMFVEIFPRLLKSMDKPDRKVLLHYLIPTDGGNILASRILDIVEQFSSKEKNKKVFVLLQQCKDGNFSTSLLKNILKKDFIAVEEFVPNVKLTIKKALEDMSNGMLACKPNLNALLERLLDLVEEFESDFRNEVIYSIACYCVKSVNGADNASECFGKMEVTTTDLDFIIIQILAKMKRENETLKKRKVESTQLSTSWVDETRLFELLLQKCIQNNICCSLKLIFDALEYILESLPSLNVELPDYLIQIILSMVSHYFHDGSRSAKPSQVRVDLIINCLRLSKNPQMQSDVIRTIAELSGVGNLKEVILHNLMPVFTFMGTSLLCLDDNQTFNVINQLVQNIVPRLLATQRNSETSIPVIKDKLKFVLVTFVHSFEHIPAHRRRQVFCDLIRVLGAKSYLGIVISLLAFKLRVSSSWEFSKVENFCLSVMDQFTLQDNIGMQMVSLEIMELILEGKTNPLSYILDLKNINVEEISKFSFLMLSLIKHCLEKANVARDALLDDFSSIVKKLVLLLPKLNNESLNAAYDNLSIMAAFLDSRQVVALVNDLMASKVTLDKAVLVMKSKVDFLKSSSSNDQEEKKIISQALLEKIAFEDKASLSVMDCLTTMVEKNQDLSLLKNKEMFSEKILNSLKTVDAESGKKLVELLQAIVMNSKHSFLPYLNQALDNTLDLFFSSKDVNTLIVLIDFIRCVVKQLPSFLGERVTRIFDMVVKYDTENYSIQQSLNLLKSESIHVLESRILIPKFIQWYNFDVQNCDKAYDYFLKILQSSSKTDIGQFYVVLFQFLLSNWDSCLCLKSYDPGLLSKINEIGVSISLKLNEAKFTPCFGKLVAWSDEDESKLGCLFTFINRLFDDFTSLLVPYFSQVHSKLLQYLKNDTNAIFFQSSMGCLSKSLRFDTNSFYNSDKLALLFDALEEILQNSFAEPQLFIDLIGELAIVSKRENCLKELNKSLLECFRLENVKSRKIAIDGLKAGIEVLKDDFVALLPDMISYLAELLEDDDSEVEKKCREVIAIIEGHLGESLNNYFN